MNKENCALKLVDEITLYYDARSKKHKKNSNMNSTTWLCSMYLLINLVVTERIILMLLRADTA